MVQIKRDTVWQEPQVAKYYLEGVRAALPLAQTQLDVMVRVLTAALPDGISTFIDLGCGDGVLAEAILFKYPEARGVCLDFSAAMLEAARERLAPHEGQLAFVNLDFGDKAWAAAEEVKACWPFDAIVSGYAIHHQPDHRKWELYEEICNLLKPGGVFLNLEHVASRTRFVENLFDEQMIDALYAYQQATGGGQTREEVAEAFYNREDQHANILVDVETQCHWLREVGFKNVDCFFKIFELALFGGVKV